ncbi:flagellar biosynthetic protein FliO [Carboxydothermus pertinax]|uniref:Flagellar biosynthetic protein FliO n=1 Tax=Carboxydothermus pertinax TaxID=870242 RepID=A0A1L8CUJ5_9THEO|nr:flagellar biosynthetic protein FliO [Carboxydothermus pertinax]GAV22571.1 flagellar biosynthetic protein FliO [Carboxydothermus pertinax]
MDSYFGQALWSLLVLFIIIAGLFFLARYVKNYRIGYKSRYIEILDRLLLSPKSGVVLLKVNGKYYLAGFGEENVSLIDVYDKEPEEIPGIAGTFDIHLSKKINEVVGQIKSGRKN